MRRLLLSTIAIVVFAFIFSACSSGESEVAAEEVQVEDQGDIARVYVDPPAEFAALTNPFSGDADALTKGNEIYESKCVECHGPEGEGDGPKSTNINPKPANLGDSTMMADLSDGYLFWRVTKGGAMEPFNLAMKAWEMALTEEQHWQVISYVRTFSEE